MPLLESAHAHPQHSARMHCSQPFAECAALLRMCWPGVPAAALKLSTRTCRAGMQAARMRGVPRAALLAADWPGVALSHARARGGGRPSTPTQTRQLQHQIPGRSLNESDDAGGGGTRRCPAAAAAPAAHQTVCNPCVRACFASLPPVTPARPRMPPLPGRLHAPAPPPCSVSPRIHSQARCQRPAPRPPAQLKRKHRGRVRRAAAARRLSSSV